MNIDRLMYREYGTQIKNKLLLVTLCESGLFFRIQSTPHGSLGKAYRTGFWVQQLWVIQHIHQLLLHSQLRLGSCMVDLPSGLSLRILPLGGIVPE